MAPEGVRCWNPAFDVTDHELITAVLTERGVVYPPYDVNLQKAVRIMKTSARPGGSFHYDLSVKHRM